MDDFTTNDFPNLSTEDQRKCVTAIAKIVHPEWTDVREPAHPKHRGRPAGVVNKRQPSFWEPQGEHESPPKKHKAGPSSTAPPKSLIKSARKYHSIIPKWLHEHVHGFWEIRSDGHCGFRSIAHGLGWGQDRWGQVRKGMMNIIGDEAGLLQAHWGSNSYYEMKCMLNCFDDWADPYYWFSLPDMGAIVATAFNVALVSIGLNNSFTYLPVKAAVGHDPAQKLQMVAILHLHKEKHWVAV